MGERYVREVFDDDLHMADSSDGDGSHRGLEYDDGNHLKGHAKYYEVDDREMYEDLKEKYGDEQNIDIEAIQRKAEALFAVGAIVAGVVHYASPYVKEWMKETAIPGVKTAFMGIKEKLSGKQDGEQAEIVKVSLDVTPENSLALVNEIEVAEKEYREKITSGEASQRFLRLVLHAMEISKELNELANAEIADEQALAKKEDWNVVDKALTRESLLEGINNILEAGDKALDPEQIELIQGLLERDLYKSGEYIPVDSGELKKIFGESSNDEDDGDESRVTSVR